MLSIIIPIYKSSDNLVECLDSVINQTLKEIEIILINDASPDHKDHELCKAYADKDKRIKYIIHESNTGQGGARNTGISNARANYIGFVDSDDWIESDMFEKLHTAIQTKKADASQCYFTEHIGSKSNLRKLKKFRKQKDFLNATNVLVWNKLFKKSLFVENNIFFPAGHSHEDTATIPRVAYFIHSMALVKEPLYHYRVNRAGATTTNYERIFNDHSVVFSMVKEFMENRDLWSSHRSYFDMRVIRSLLHDVTRLMRDNSLSEDSKKSMIDAGLNKTVSLLGNPQRINGSSLKEIKSSLQQYRLQLLVRSLKI